MEASEIFLGQDFNIEQYPAEFLLIRIGYLLLLFFLTTALINYSLHSFWDKRLDYCNRLIMNLFVGLLFQLCFFPVFLIT